MTALLEFKQKLKGLYAQYEIYLLPLLKFILAAVYFTWINTNMGYMRALDNMFVVLILALICCILPSGMMIFTGFALMVGHSYALGIDSVYDDSFSAFQQWQKYGSYFCTTCIWF